MKKIFSLGSGSVFRMGILIQERKWTRIRIHSPSLTSLLMFQVCQRPAEAGVWCGASAGVRHNAGGCYVHPLGPPACQATAICPQLWGEGQTVWRMLCSPTGPTSLPGASAMRAAMRWGSDSVADVVFTRWAHQPARVQRYARSYEVKVRHSVAVQSLPVLGVLNPWASKGCGCRKLVPGTKNKFLLVKAWLQDKYQVSKNVMSFIT